MKKTCVSYLKCISCNQSDLFLKIDKEDPDNEVIEGLLECPCGKSYPIIKGVPRILPENLLRNVMSYYENVISEENISQQSSKAENRVLEIQKKTMEAFGFEWTEYSDYDADNYYNWIPVGFDPEDGFSNKIGLEVGCGAGRHAEKTSQWAKIHFAVDLSFAVDSAFERNRKLDNCHVVQADAYHLPFKEGEIFDYVYCLGVLQHMHEPTVGFKHLAAQPKKNGILLVNIYQSSRPITMWMLECMRKITTKMPHQLLNVFCFFFGILDFYFCIFWKFTNYVGMEKVFAKIIPQRTKEYAKHNFKTIVADWYDRLACPVKLHYSDQELTEWYKQEEYKEIKVTPYWSAFWNGYGVRT